MAKTRSGARHGPLTGEGPDDGGHCPGEGDHHRVGRLPSCGERSEPRAQAPLGVPPERRDGRGSRRHAPLARAAARGRIPVGPRAREEGPAGARVPGVGEAALAAACAPGVGPGGEAARAHERSRVLATGQLTECRHAGDGPRALEAAPRLESLDDGGETPALGLRREGGLQTREPVLRVRNGADGLLEAHRLGGRRADDFRQPASRGRSPGGAARMPALLAQEEGLHTGLGGLAIPDRRLTGAGQVAEGLVRARWARDGRQRAGTPQAGARDGVASIGLAAGPRVRRDQGRGHAPAAPVWLREVPVEPGATGTGVVDDDARGGVRRALSDPRVEVARARAAGAQEDQLGGPLFRGLGPGEGLVVAIQTAGKGARVTQG